MTTITENQTARKNWQVKNATNSVSKLSKKASNNDLLLNPSYKLNKTEKEGFTEAKLDLNELLIKNSNKSFLIRVSGDSMIGAGINTGDLLLVDCITQPTDGKIVVAAINNELLVKRIKFKEDGVYLEAENNLYEPIKIEKTDKFDVWGIVSSVIKMYY